MKTKNTPNIERYDGFSKISETFMRKVYCEIENNKEFFYNEGILLRTHIVCLRWSAMRKYVQSCSLLPPWRTISSKFFSLNIIITSFTPTLDLFLLYFVNLFLSRYLILILYYFFSFHSCDDIFFNLIKTLNNLM